MDRIKQVPQYEHTNVPFKEYPKHAKCGEEAEREEEKREKTKYFPTMPPRMQNRYASKHPLLNLIVPKYPSNANPCHAMAYQTHPTRKKSNKRMRRVKKRRYARYSIHNAQFDPGSEIAAHQGLTKSLFIFLTGCSKMPGKHILSSSKAPSLPGPPSVCSASPHRCMLMGQLSHLRYRLRGKREA